ncbi:hypothetical protein L593_08570 [Salinarchaeum sp. Harcht-Bsk1]|uniref:hypothetical protein n=1 Tax=Salinarchaeum sp. Harcht-Bsk1 TaxID=1333523 RepID=UPI0003423C58|nr:hypothetical protein [Salinarchaeum sp. Harcht-Bsk1]AGN01659.1 hypothetical protein L593_08570 [Salinarchaeum sp. Harcht-Bsk1]
MQSRGDPRVHFVMNLVLSGLFAYIVLWGLDLLGVVGFTLTRLATATLLLMVLTYIMTQ